MGVFAALVSWLLVISDIFRTDTDPFQLALVVAVATLVVLVVGSLAGSGIPVILRKFGLDPALAASIFLTLLTDTVGFGGFLLLAAWFLG